MTDHKQLKMTKPQKAMRFIRSLIDPGSYLHALRVMNIQAVTGYRERKKAKIGPNAGISPLSCFINGERITIGDHTTIGPNVTLMAGANSGRITIGENCLFGPNALLTSANYDLTSPEPLNSIPMNEADIIVGNDVWVGAGAVILAGVTVSDHAVLAANTVVTKDVPEWSIIGGVPGRVIGTRTHSKD